MTSLEALAIDYVKAFDKMCEWSKKMSDYRLANGPETCRGQEFQDLEFQYNQGWGSVSSSLTAIRSHVHAAYSAELAQGPGQVAEVAEVAEERKEVGE